VFSFAAAEAESTQNRGVMSSNPSNTEAAARELTLEGCVGGQERYTFMQAGTGAMFQLMSRDPQLAAARGKFAEITARELPPNPDASSPASPQLEVRNLRILGQECPIPPRGTPSSERTQPQARPAPSPATPRYSPMGAPDQTPPAVGHNPNAPGTSGTPSPGTGNPPPQPPPPQPHP
jgi:hypothetical protein